MGTQDSGRSGSEPARPAPTEEQAPLTPGALPYSLTRTLVIRAPRALVFRYFTDSARFAAWWGKGSEIDARPGGAMLIRYPNNAIARGTVESIEADTRIVFTYGYDDPQQPVRPGGSRVTITLQDDPAGTHLELRHDFTTARIRDMHDAGWRYQLSLFANVVTRELHADVAALMDRFFSAWNETRQPERRALLDALVTADVEFHDRYAAVNGLEDLDRHLAAIHLHMPGMPIERASPPRECQGGVLTDWVVRRQGEVAGRGINFFELAPTGLIRRVFGFWAD